MEHPDQSSYFGAPSFNIKEEFLMAALVLLLAGADRLKQKNVVKQISKWLIEQREITNKLLTRHIKEVQAIADALIEKQDLTGDEVLQIIKGIGGKNERV